MGLFKDFDTDRAAADPVLSALAGVQASVQRLMALGVAGEATVTSMRDSGASVNDNPELELGLSVVLPGGDAYAVLHRQVVSPLVLKNFLPGTTLPVRVDPDDPQQLIIA